VSKLPGLVLPKRLIFFEVRKTVMSNWFFDCRLNFLVILIFVQFLGNIKSQVLKRVQNEEFNTAFKPMNESEAYTRGFPLLACNLSSMSNSSLFNSTNEKEIHCTSTDLQVETFTNTNDLVKCTIPVYYWNPYYRCYSKVNVPYFPTRHENVDVMTRRATFFVPIPFKGLTQLWLDDLPLFGFKSMQPYITSILNGGNLTLRVIPS
jgi:hypothetical protein